MTVQVTAGSTNPMERHEVYSVEWEE